MIGEGFFFGVVLWVWLFLFFVDVFCLFFFSVLTGEYPAEKEALMPRLYSSGSSDLEQVKQSGWEKDW